MDEKALQIVFSSIAELNRMRSVEDQLPQSIDTVLDGKSGKLDSLGLVNLIVAIEEEVERIYGIRISLSNSSVASRQVSPFSNIGTLANYLSTLLKEKIGG